MDYFTWLPIGTDAKVGAPPRVTAGLAALCVLASAAALLLGEEALYGLAFKAADPSILTALTSLFLHAGPGHLLGTLLFLSIFGPPLEARLGGARYLGAFLGAGWAAHLGQAAALVWSDPAMAAVPIVGASGATSGILGAFLVRLSFARLRFLSPAMLVRHGLVRPARFAPPALAGIGLWFAAAAASPLAGFGSEAAWAGHAGGAIFGALAALGMGLRSEARLERRLWLAARHVESGAWAPALEEYERYLAGAPDDPDALLEAARLLRVTHQEAAASQRFREAIQVRLRRGELALASDAYDEMRRLLGEGSDLPAAEELLLARGLDDLGRAGAASRAYERYGTRHADHEAAALAMLRSADLEWRALRNPGRARWIYEELLTRGLAPELESIVRQRKRDAERSQEREEQGAV